MDASPTRRYFDEAAKAQGKADGRAHQALDLIGRLYQVEALAKETLPEGSSRADYTFALRQQHSLPVLAALETWLDQHAETVLPKSLLGAAITYARNQWPYLRRYADDGNAHIDNKLIERDIRPFTTEQKKLAVQFHGRRRQRQRRDLQHHADLSRLRGRAVCLSAARADRIATPCRR